MWHTCIAPEGNVQRAIWIWASSKSFSQGYWPCHSTDRASGTFSAITARGATRTVKPKKATDSCAGNRLIASLPIVGGRPRFHNPAADKADCRHRLFYYAKVNYHTKRHQPRMLIPPSILASVPPSSLRPFAPSRLIGYSANGARIYLETSGNFNVSAAI